MTTEPTTSHAPKGTTMTTTEHRLAAAEATAARLATEAARAHAGLAAWDTGTRTPRRADDRRQRAIRQAADAEYQARVAEQRAAWLRARIRAHRKATA